MKRLQTLAAIAALSLASPSTAANLIVDGGGKLTGATGIDIGGLIYDVEFVDGTCISVFSGCDSLADFAFASSAAAETAGQALLDQVFLGIYDDQPELTLGCSDTEYCSVLIPHTLQASPAVVFFTPASNGSTDGNFPDNVGSGGAILTFDSTNSTGQVWARFTPNAVPEPSTWAMLLLGFGAIGISLRRRRDREAVA